LAKVKTIDQNSRNVAFQDAGIHRILLYCRYFLVDFYAPTTTVDSIMEHLSRDIDVIRPNIVKHPLTQEVKECEGIVPVPLEEKLYSTKKRKK
jgi:ribosomal protein S6